MHVPTSGGWDGSGAVIVTSTSGHGSGTAGRTSAGATGRAGPVIRRRRTAQLELAVLLDRAENVGDGKRCGVHCVMIVMMMMVMRFGAQRHR